MTMTMTKTMRMKMMMRRRKTEQMLRLICPIKDLPLQEHRQQSLKGRGRGREKGKTLWTQSVFLNSTHQQHLNSTQTNIHSSSIYPAQSLRTRDRRRLERVRHSPPPHAPYAIRCSPSEARSPNTLLSTTVSLRMFVILSYEWTD